MTQQKERTPLIMSLMKANLDKPLDVRTQMAYENLWAMIKKQGARDSITELFAAGYVCEFLNETIIELAPSFSEFNITQDLLDDAVIGHACKLLLHWKQKTEAAQVTYDAEADAK